MTGLVCRDLSCRRRQEPTGPWHQGLHAFRWGGVDLGMHRVPIGMESQR